MEYPAKLPGLRRLNVKRSCDTNIIPMLLAKNLKLDWDFFFNSSQKNSFQDSTYCKLLRSFWLRRSYSENTEVVRSLDLILAPRFPSLRLTNEVITPWNSWCGLAGCPGGTESARVRCPSERRESLYAGDSAPNTCTSFPLSGPQVPCPSEGHTDSIPTRLTGDMGPKRDFWVHTVP